MPAQPAFERIARNESQFRDINDELEAGLRALPGGPELLDFICECGNRACSETVRMRLDEYGAVRQSGRRFVVVGGHDIPGVERVVGANERFQVVEKIEESAGRAEELGSRR